MHMPPQHMHMYGPSKPDILCILGPPIDSHTPIPLNPVNSIQFIESRITMIIPKYCHKRKNINKYDPLIQTLKTTGWNVTPFITITTWGQGAFHKQSF
jgi:hypothetical protein